MPLEAPVTMARRLLNSRLIASLSLSSGKQRPWQSVNDYAVMATGGLPLTTDQLQFFA